MPSVYSYEQYASIRRKILRQMTPSGVSFKLDPLNLKLEINDEKTPKAEWGHTCKNILRKANTFFHDNFDELCAVKRAIMNGEEPEEEDSSVEDPEDEVDGAASPVWATTQDGSASPDLDQGFQPVEEVNEDIGAVPFENVESFLRDESGFEVLPGTGLLGKRGFEAHNDMLSQLDADPSSLEPPCTQRQLDLENHNTMFSARRNTTKNVENSEIVNPAPVPRGRRDLGQSG